MPLSWNEIRNRAHAFSRKWAEEASERAEAQSFWNDFFAVFGIERKRVAIFEKQVSIARAGEKLKQGRIDAFWKGVLLIEHKSRGQDLSRAFAQAADYFDGIAERDLPRYILVSDFAHFRLYDLESSFPTSPPTPHRTTSLQTNSPLSRERERVGERVAAENGVTLPGVGYTEFKLAELPKHIKHFAFIAGYRTQVIAPQNPVNIKAAERMGRLHDQLKASGYSGHPLEVLLVRLLFCLFADDTGIFQPAGSFRLWLEERTAADGSDLGSQLAQFFQVLNTLESKRSNNLDEQLAAFPYVNGKLFEENLSIASFDAAMRESLLDCCALDWSAISPAIFGALFQSIMDASARRNLGAHYTSEENILKLIKPLFLDDLQAEFKRVRSNKNKLFEFHKKLRSLTFFDPACGCGNFLVIAYRELRALELEVLRASLSLEMKSGQSFVDVQNLIGVDVDQFYGIEIEEFPAQIAQVALWLMDHQMNLRVSEEFGMYFARIPLKTTPHIHHGNALTTDWNAVLPAEKASYVFGNPPFVGAKYMSDAQREQTRQVFEGINGGGLLDFVAAWYVKAAHYLTTVRPEPVEGLTSAHASTSYASTSSARTGVRCAFVSTNSITQGEQVGVLWSWLLSKGIHIHFAHRTFQWSNEARGMAAVHCVIIGFCAFDVSKKTIYAYDDIRGEPHAVPVANINPYLVDAADVVLTRRSMPICNVPEIGIGNKPIDDGQYLFTPEERDEFLKREPKAAKYFRRWLGADEFLNGYERWCLWLGDCPPNELRQMPLAMARVEAVKCSRLASKSAPTRKLAETPTRFHVENMPSGNYILIPEVTSERRHFIPIGFESPDTFCSNLVKIVPDATLYHFGVLSSTMHNAWLRCVAGRLESRYRYSAHIVYNNFPWPNNPSKTQQQKIETAAQAVLDARAKFPDATLADLYDPLTMPPILVRAHQKLDTAVDAAYGKKSFNNDAERVAFLFDLYQQYTTLLPVVTKSKRARKPDRS